MRNREKRKCGPVRIGPARVEPGPVFRGPGPTAEHTAAYKAAGPMRWVTCVHGPIGKATLPRMLPGSVAKIGMEIITTRPACTSVPSPRSPAIIYYYFCHEKSIEGVDLPLPTCASLSLSCSTLSRLRAASSSTVTVSHAGRGVEPP